MFVKAKIMSCLHSLHAEKSQVLILGNLKRIHGQQTQHFEEQPKTPERQNLTKGIQLVQQAGSGPVLWFTDH